MFEATAPAPVTTPAPAAQTTGGLFGAPSLLKEQGRLFGFKKLAITNRD